MNAHALAVTAPEPTPLGTIAYTEEAYTFLRDHSAAWLYQFARYRSGDWGEIPDGDARINDAILDQSPAGTTHNRIYGRYTVDGHTITIATDQLDGDNPYTTIYLGATR